MRKKHLYAPEVEGLESKDLGPSKKGEKQQSLETSLFQVSSLSTCFFASSDETLVDVVRP